jgi:uncharacterized protein YbbK (DUF523 family)
MNRPLAARCSQSGRLATHAWNPRGAQGPPELTNAMGTAVRIGVSACLLGQQVRFDGGHKRDAFLTETLAPHVAWVPVCPEVEVGMGTPREPLRLVRANGRTHMVTTRTAIDYTGTMSAWAERRLDELAREDLDGYILKKDSPSCGVERVKVYRGDGSAVRDGRGLFAGALLARLPLLPVEDEGRLADAHRRGDFLERVFAFRRLKDFFAGPWTLESLVRFHQAHAAILGARSRASEGELGRFVAGGALLPKPDLRLRYQELFMSTLALQARTRRRAIALEQIDRMLGDDV